MLPTFRQLLRLTYNVRRRSCENPFGSEWRSSGCCWLRLDWSVMVSRVNKSLNIDYLMPPEEDVEWIFQGSCLDLDPEMFTLGDPRNSEALSVCSGCPVKKECYSRAVRLGLGGLIFGGSTNLKEPRIGPTGNVANRDKMFCKWDHEFTPDNIFWARNGTSRQCKACRRAVSASQRRKKKDGHRQSDQHS